MVAVVLAVLGTLFDDLVLDDGNSDDNRTVIAHSALAFPKWVIWGPLVR